jgi:hypothetical protein
MQNQAEVCGKGRSDSRNRPGYLISWGFCFNTNDGYSNQNLAVLESMLIGNPIPIQDVWLDKKVSMYPLKIFSQPPRNIRDVLPTEYLPDGTGIAFNEAAFTPYFAEGNMSDLLRASRKKGEHEYQERLRKEEANKLERERQQKLNGNGDSATKVEPM